jgi:transcriptional regulator with XRE-family HTH domain
MATRNGGRDRVSTKAKLAGELATLGAVLAKAREDRGLKQLDVAAKLGLPASHLSKIESGTRRLDVIELMRIADALGVDPAEIIEELRLRLRAMSA